LEFFFFVIKNKVPYFVESALICGGACAFLFFSWIGFCRRWINVKGSFIFLLS